MVIAPKAKKAPKVTKAIAKAPKFRTLADVMKRLGDVPYERVRFYPPVGTATVADVTHIQEKEGRLCELVDGVLVEKTTGLAESGRHRLHSGHPIDDAHQR